MMFVQVSFFLWCISNRSSLIYTLFDSAGSPPIYTQTFSDLMAFARGDVDLVVIVVLIQDGFVCDFKSNLRSTSNWYTLKSLAKDFKTTITTKYIISKKEASNKTHRACLPGSL